MSSVLRRTRATRATALAFKLRDSALDPQGGSIDLAQGERMPENLIGSPCFEAEVLRLRHR